MSAKQNDGLGKWVDPDDARELTEHDFETGVWEINGVRIPTPPKRGRPRQETTKVHTRLRIDPDLLDHFKAGGKGWQTRINAALREQVERARHEG